MPWRRIELALHVPTEDGETTIRLWSNLPDEVGAGRIGDFYRTRWRIEHLFGAWKACCTVNHQPGPPARRCWVRGCRLAYNVLARSALRGAGACPTAAAKQAAAGVSPSTWPYKSRQLRGPDHCCAARTWPSRNQPTLWAWPNGC